MLMHMEAGNKQLGAKDGPDHIRHEAVAVPKSLDISSRATSVMNPATLPSLPPDHALLLS